MTLVTTKPFFSAIITGPWELGGASYDSISFSVSGQTSSPTGLAFRGNGKDMYVISNNTDTIFQYALTTGWDLSTAGYASKSLSVVAQDNNPNDVQFNPAGTRMYITGGQNGAIFQYALTTSWDLSTASYTGVSFSVAAQVLFPFGMAFDSSGTKMYVTGNTSDTVYQYSLGAAYDLSTASYFGVSFSVAAQVSTPSGIAFDSGGTRMFVTEGVSTVYQYALTTGWDLSTASYGGVFFGTFPPSAVPRGVQFSLDGTKMFLVDGNSSLYQFSL